jgi:hypothetical protein
MRAMREVFEFIEQFVHRAVELPGMRPRVLNLAGSLAKKTPSGHPHMFFFLKTRVSVTNKETMNKPSALL